MIPLPSFLTSAAARLTAIAPGLLPLLARLVFAGVLAGYFWTSALTKFAGPFTPSFGAYGQIFPRAFEAVGANTDNLGLWHWAVALAGGYAEFLLPALLILGLFTRLASLGMVGFIVVQSLTDIVGHGADAATIGAWFDRFSDALILDQRGLWVLLLSIPLLLGPGWLALDRWAWRRAA
jgi:putative oxidoreductase